MKLPSQSIRISDALKTSGTIFLKEKHFSAIYLVLPLIYITGVKMSELELLSYSKIRSKWTLEYFIPSYYTSRYTCQADFILFHSSLVSPFQEEKSTKNQEGKEPPCTAYSQQEELFPVLPLRSG